MYDKSNFFPFKTYLMKNVFHDEMQMTDIMNHENSNR